MRTHHLVPRRVAQDNHMGHLHHMQRREHRTVIVHRVWHGYSQNQALQCHLLFADEPYCLHLLSSPVLCAQQNWRR